MSQRKTSRCKTVIILFLGGFLLMTTAILWVSEKRTFFYLKDGFYLTGWKRMGGTCYIVPGKYYGLSKPTDSHIVTSNLNSVTIYYTQKQPKNLIVRNEDDYDVELFNNQKSSFLLSNFDSSREFYIGLLYGDTTKKFYQVKPDVEYIDIDIRHLYAKNKNRKRI